MKTVSKYQPLQHYKWGSNCDGWNLADEQNLSVKQEKMPPLSSEQLHYHEHAQQFFFILNGKALFEIEGETVGLEKGNGILIKQGQRHKIMNQEKEDLEFILCSAPSTVNDRINC